MSARVALPIVEKVMDGGYSGDIAITRGRAGDPDANPDMVFVESASSDSGSS